MRGGEALTSSRIQGVEFQGPTIGFVRILLPGRMRRPMAFLPKSTDLDDLRVDDLQGVLREVHTPVKQNAPRNRSAVPPPGLRGGVRTRMQMNSLNVTEITAPDRVPLLLLLDY